MTNDNFEKKCETKKTSDKECNLVNTFFKYWLNTRKYYNNISEYCHNICEYWAGEYTLRLYSQVAAVVWVWQFAMQWLQCHLMK